jgi:hypothetical protein
MRLSAFPLWWWALTPAKESPCPFAKQAAPSMRKLGKHHFQRVDVPLVRHARRNKFRMLAEEAVFCGHGNDKFERWSTKKVEHL